MQMGAGFWIVNFNLIFRGRVCNVNDFLYQLQHRENGTTVLSNNEEKPQK